MGQDVLTNNDAVTTVDNMVQNDSESTEVQNTDMSTDSTESTQEQDVTESNESASEADESKESEGDDKKSSAAEALKLQEENKKLKPFADLGYIAAKLAQTHPEVKKALEAVTQAVEKGDDIDVAIENLGKQINDASKEDKTEDKVESEGQSDVAKLDPIVERELKYAATRVAESYPQIMVLDDKAKAVGKRAFELFTNDGLPMMEAWSKSAKEIYGSPLSVEASKFKQDMVSGISGGSSSAGTGVDKMTTAAINVNKANSKISVEEAKRLFESGALEMSDYLD